MPADWVNNILPTFTADLPVDLFMFDDESIVANQSVTNYGSSGITGTIKAANSNSSLPIPNASSLLPASKTATGWDVNVNSVTGSLEQVVYVGPDTSTLLSPEWTKITLEAVVIPRSLTTYISGNNTGPIIEYKRSAASNRPGVSLLISNFSTPRWRFEICGRNASDVEITENIDPTTAITYDVLQHLVATWDGSTGEVKFYLNGTLDRTTSSLVTKLTAFQKRWLFHRGIGTYNYWTGVAFLAGVYNSVLSATRIQEHWTAINTIPVEETLNSKRFVSLFFG